MAAQQGRYRAAQAVGSLIPLCGLARGTGRQALRRHRTVLLMAVHRVLDQRFQFPQELFGPLRPLGEHTHPGALTADLPSAGDQLLVLLDGEGDRLTAPKGDAARLRVSGQWVPPLLGFAVPDLSVGVLCHARVPIASVPGKRERAPGWFRRALSCPKTVSASREPSARTGPSRAWDSAAARPTRRRTGRIRPTGRPGW